MADASDVSDTSDQAPGPLSRGCIRALIASAGLAVIWGVAFAARLLPFCPTIMAGGVLSGVAGIWVRGGTRGRHPGESERRGYAGLASTPAHIRLAVVVAIGHFVVGHGLFAVGGRLVPALTETASAVYARAGGFPLWAAVLFGAVVTAPLEEVFWRGGVQPLVAAFVHQRFPDSAAGAGGTVLASAMLYSAFHVVTGQVVLVAAALLGGLVWGWLLERTHSLGACMLTHGLWTGLILVVPPV